MSLREVVVVGASLAGLRAAEALRTGGYEGALTVVGGEEHRPYDRPPLSKKVLAGEMELDRITLRKPEVWDDLGVTWVLGHHATGLDVAGRAVLLDDGRSLPYDGLIIATGAAPRRLPALEGFAGVHVLRTLDDSLALRADLEAGPRHVAVIGAGFIGSEVAATARSRGLEVTVLEALPVPLARGLGAVMGPVVAGLHADHGVHLRLGVTVEGAEGAGGRVERLKLAGGEVLEADVVVVGIGVVPTTAWLEGSGLELRDGLVCDATLATTAPGVFGAGDVVRWFHPGLGQEIRAEHWTNATEQGAHAARNLLAGPGGAVPFDSVPFVWSDQYDVRIQVLGHPGYDDEVQVVRGSIEERKFVAIYGREGRLTAALGMSMPRYLMAYRALLEAGTSWDDAIAHAAAS